MGLFTGLHLKKLQKAITEGDLNTLKKQFNRLDDEVLASHRFQFNGLELNAAELAIHSQQAKSLEHLLQAGSGLHHSTPAPLIYQALQQPQQSLALMTILLQQGAPQDYPDQDPCHLLLACFTFCPIETLMLHLSRCNENGADLNFRDSNGVTPLLLALKTEHQPLVQMLVNSGAELPKQIPEDWCSETIIGHAKRCADDLKIRQMMLS